ncbi:hypothetical protein HAZT_HAZT007274 [Hyalella azteca]|uniref:IST1 homolog n=1 Tax=Hyalella azteca TaxID=294128 RepID=A0A6A0GU37_HYAAZ|nr:hypothetical protein HAZT_HAZT007274 [Hyalella azteca]
MFSSGPRGPSYAKLKTNLQSSINKLKLLEKKKMESTLKARKEIAHYIAAGKTERAKIRVEHIIREDYLVEAMDVTEMYCNLVLARFGLIQQMKRVHPFRVDKRDLDPGLSEAISSLVWCAPRLMSDVPELKIVADQFALKYGKPYAVACREQSISTISEKLIHKLSVQAPPKVLVEKYLQEIAYNHNLEYTPDPQIMRESEWGADALITLDVGSKSGGASGGGGSGIPQQPFSYPNLIQQLYEFSILLNILQKEVRDFGISRMSAEIRYLLSRFLSFTYLSVMLWMMVRHAFFLFVSSSQIFCITRKNIYRTLL